MMKNILLIFSLVLMSTNLLAKNADDYFHSAGAMYIEGRQQQALIEVEEGVRKYPTDPKLSTLSEHLKKLEEQQQKDQQQNSGNGQDEQNKDDKKDEGKKGDGENQDKNSPKDSSQNNEDDKGDSDKDSSGQDMQESDNPPPGEMSKEEAKRLLDSYKNDEKADQKNMRKSNKGKGRNAQDW